MVSPESMLFWPPLEPHYPFVVYLEDNAKEGFTEIPIKIPKPIFLIKNPGKMSDKSGKTGHIIGITYTDFSNIFTLILQHFRVCKPTWKNYQCRESSNISSNSKWWLSKWWLSRKSKFENKKRNFLFRVSVQSGKCYPRLK